MVFSPDSLLSLAFIIPTIVLIFLYKKERKGFVNADGNLGVYPFVATLVVSFYGWILGVGEVFYNQGSVSWLYLSFPYILAVLIYAIFFVHKIQLHKDRTLFDRINRAYGNKIARFSSFVLLLVLLPVMYHLMGARILAFIFNIPQTYALAFLILLSALGVQLGGFKHLVKIQKIYFPLMFIGFGVLLYYQNPSAKELIQVPKNISANAFNPSFLKYIEWFLLASVVLIDPSFYHRISAGTRKKSGSRAIWIVLVCFLLFDYLELTTVAVGKSRISAIADAQYFYPILALKTLPKYVLGLFWSVLLMIVLSTADSLYFLFSVTFFKDVVGTKGNLVPTVVKYNFPIAVLMFFVSLIFINSTVVEIFWDTWSLVAVILLVPILATYLHKTLPNKWVVFQMCASAMVWIGFIIPYKNAADNSELIHPVIYGVLVSLVIYGAYWLIKRLKA